MKFLKRTIFRSFANIIKMSVDSSREINNLSKSCPGAFKMMFLGLVFLEILNNFVVPLGWRAALRMD